MSQKLRQMEEKQGHIQELKVKFYRVQLISPRKQNLYLPLACYGVNFRHICKIAKNDHYLCHVRPSVCLSACLHGTTWLPMNRFSLNLLFEDFSKICPENSSFFKKRIMGALHKDLYTFTIISR